MSCCSSVKFVVIGSCVLQALCKVGKTDAKVEDFVLVEDVHSGWEKKDQEKIGQQRILSMGERVLQSQNKWKGSGKFILRKKSDVSLSCPSYEVFRVHQIQLTSK